MDHKAENVRALWQQLGHKAENLSVLGLQLSWSIQNLRALEQQLGHKAQNLRPLALKIWKFSPWGLSRLGKTGLGKLIFGAKNV